jgi:hypothetical protein
MPRNNIPLEDVTDLILTWQTRRKALARPFKADGLREFVAVMNGITRQVMSRVDTNDPEFWSAWIEIGTQASTFAHNAKTFADHIDRSDL